MVQGEVENQILAYASESNGRVEVQVTKPGLVDNPGRNVVAQTLRGWTGIPRVDVTELAAAELDQAIKGFEKEVLPKAPTENRTSKTITTSTQVYHILGFQHNSVRNNFCSLYKERQQLSLAFLYSLIVKEQSQFMKV